ncbi:hypothetical protein [Pleomorphomonas carboxyditropha]|uniref:Uncharacterized protein n=1 Tax=Pleomorphomonas carboxyditropha TaxID=2023338 RepID=A0A2G9WSL7_9HYPH|nr:hypothetical protein [Pleomorphomonas carboxyditropha]PIO97707.1 hypothetical protein CJ014_18670 [Pleomorphomonas carboxyditropha]
MMTVVQLALDPDRAARLLQQYDRDLMGLLGTFIEEISQEFIWDDRPIFRQRTIELMGEIIRLGSLPAISVESLHVRRRLPCLCTDILVLIREAGDGSPDRPMQREMPGGAEEEI